MILRRYGKTFESVELNFDSKALNEIGFRRDREQSFDAEEFGSTYRRGGYGVRMAAEVRQILEETAKETQAFVYESAARLEDELLTKINDESDIEVNEADKDAFIEASKPIYEEFGNQVEGGKAIVDKAVELGSGS